MPIQLKTTLSAYLRQGPLVDNPLDSLASQDSLEIESLDICKIFHKNISIDSRGFSVIDDTTSKPIIIRDSTYLNSFSKEKEFSNTNNEFKDARGDIYLEIKSKPISDHIYDLIVKNKIRLRFNRRIRGNRYIFPRYFKHVQKDYALGTTEISDIKYAPLYNKFLITISPNDVITDSNGVKRVIKYINFTQLNLETKFFSMKGNDSLVSFRKLTEDNFSFNNGHISRIDFGKNGIKGWGSLFNLTSNSSLFLTRGVDKKSILDIYLNTAYDSYENIVDKTFKTFGGERYKGLQTFPTYITDIEKSLLCYGATSKKTTKSFWARNNLSFGGRVYTKFAESCKNDTVNVDEISGISFPEFSLWTYRPISLILHQSQAVDLTTIQKSQLRRNLLFIYRNLLANYKVKTATHLSLIKVNEDDINVISLSSAYCYLRNKFKDSPETSINLVRSQIINTDSPLYQLNNHRGSGFALLYDMNGFNFDPDSSTSRKYNHTLYNYCLPPYTIDRYKLDFACLKNPDTYYTDTTGSIFEIEYPQYDNYIESRNYIAGTCHFLNHSREMNLFTKEFEENERVPSVLEFGNIITIKR